MLEDKITIILNGREITLSSLTSFMLREEFKGVFKSDFVNIDILDNSTKIILLDRIFTLESNSAVIIYDDETLKDIPDGRKIHNDLFNRVRLVDSMIKFREKNNDNVDEYKLKKLPEIIININEYIDYMRNFDNKNRKI